MKYVSNDIEYRTTEISFKNIAFMVPPLTGTAGYDYTSNDLKKHTVTAFEGFEVDIDGHLESNIIN